MSETDATNGADVMTSYFTAEVSSSSPKRKIDNPPQRFIKKARSSVSPLNVVKENECLTSNNLEIAGSSALYKNSSDMTTKETYNKCEENSNLQNGLKECRQLHKISYEMKNGLKGIANHEPSTVYNGVMENSILHNSGNDKLQKSNNKMISCEKDNQSNGISTLYSLLNKESALHYSEKGILSKNEGKITNCDTEEKNVLRNDQIETSQQYKYGDGVLDESRSEMTNREKYNEIYKYSVLHNDRNKTSALANDSKKINSFKDNEKEENEVILHGGKHTMFKNNRGPTNGENGIEREKEPKNKQKEIPNNKSWMSEDSEPAVNLFDEKHETSAEPNTSRIDGSDPSLVKGDDTMEITHSKLQQTTTEEKNNDAKTTASRRKSQSPSKITFIPKPRVSQEASNNKTEIIRKSNRTPKKSQLMKEHEEGKKFFKNSEPESAGLPVILGSDSETPTRSAKANTGRPKGSKNRTSRPNKRKGRRKKGKTSEIQSEPNLSIDPRFGGKVSVPTSYRSKTEKQAELKGPKIKITGCPSLPKTIKFLDQEEENREKKVMKVIKDQQRFYKPTVFLTENKEMVDKSWICLFCKKRSHEQALGDLLGPYFVTTAQEEEIAQKKQGLADNESIHGDELETWFHERCLYWAPNIYMLAGKIIGIEGVIQELQNSACNHCHIEGATIACYKRGCENRCHFPCATGKWQLIENSYRCYCPRHII